MNEPRDINTREKKYIWRTLDDYRFKRKSAHTYKRTENFKDRDEENNHETHLTELHVQNTSFTFNAKFKTSYSMRIFQAELFKVYYIIIIIIMQL